jgi:hypothetical protein
MYYFEFHEQCFVSAINQPVLMKFLYLSLLPPLNPWVFALPFPSSSFDPIVKICVSINLFFVASA